jgi:type 1 glutamine amidotransferase
MFRELGAQHGFSVTATEDPSAFTDLSRFAAVVFLSTSGTVLTAEGRTALEAYVSGGGGFVGVHAAACTEYAWPPFEGLVGAWFDGHPEIQPGRIVVEDHDHPATAHLGPVWERVDEWYNFRSNPRGSVRVLATVDESSYTGGTLGADHPLVWCHEPGAGRSFYTALGHSTESYSETAFRLHILGGLRYAAGWN